MPSIGAVVGMELAKADREFFDYVKNELVSSILQDGKYELAKGIETNTYPIKTDGVKKKVLVGLRHALTFGSEMKDRKKLFFNYLYSLPEEDKSVVNSHARKQFSDNADDVGIMKLTNIEVILMPNEYRKVVFANAIAQATKDKH